MNLLGCHFFFVQGTPCILQLIDSHGKDGLHEDKGKQGHDQSNLFHILFPPQII